MEHKDHPAVGKAWGMSVTLSCAALLFVSGFALQSLSFALVPIGREWSMDPAEHGLLLAAAPGGLMLGYLLVAPAADRIGANRLTAGCVLVLAIALIASVAATWSCQS